MKFDYVSISITEAERLGLAKYRKRDKKGNVILNQSDMVSIGEPDETLEEKVLRLGGEILTQKEALKRLKK
jgi:hypothetical protein